MDIASNDCFYIYILGRERHPLEWDLFSGDIIARWYHLERDLSSRYAVSSEMISSWTRSLEMCRLVLLFSRDVVLNEICRTRSHIERSRLKRNAIISLRDVSSHNDELSQLSCLRVLVWPLENPFFLSDINTPRSMYEIIRKYLGTEYAMSRLGNLLLNECTAEGEKKKKRKQILFGNIKLSFLL